jgi:hypothetical protein
VERAHALWKPRRAKKLPSGAEFFLADHPPAIGQSATEDGKTIEFYRVRITTAGR